MSLIELFAAICGFICVYLTIKENIWCWPVGLVQVALYIFIFYDAKLYSDVLLHIVYVFMQFYGWYYWLHGGKEQKEAQITELSKSWFAFYIVGSGLAVILLGYGMASATDASFPYADAFTTVFSLSAQWLLSRKKLESWHFWIAVDCVAIFIYFQKSLYSTAILYGLFLGMAIAGLLRWRKTLLESELGDDSQLDLEPAV
jgi:nicotinamide mononucleotide transporter